MRIALVVSSGKRDPCGGMVSILYAHHEVHAGNFWSFERSSAVDNGNNSDVRMKTGDEEFHFTMAVGVTGQCIFYLYEAATISGGTPITSYNRRRLSTDTSPITVTHTPTVGATGSVALVDGRIIPGGSSPPSRVGGEVREGLEWVLKPNTEYLIRVTNQSGSSATINIYGGGYPEDL